ncbi:efflux RND transporter permease subunit, partial [Pantoea sp. SIMBA_072]
PNGLNDEPQYQLTIDDERASALGVTIADINNTLSIALGASYVNDFIDRGRVKKVYIQGEPNARMSPEDLQKWYVRNGAGEMVPFSSFA